MTLDTLLQVPGLRTALEAGIAAAMTTGIIFLSQKAQDYKDVLQQYLVALSKYSSIKKEFLIVKARFMEMQSDGEIDQAEAAEAIAYCLKLLNSLEESFGSRKKELQ